MSVAPAFEKARADGRAALVGYLPAEFPDVAGGIDAMRVMVDSGCDIIEVGLPYSDPVMDGPRSRPPPSRRSSAASAPPTCCARSRRSPPPAPPP